MKQINCLKISFFTACLTSLIFQQSESNGFNDEFNYTKEIVIAKVTR